MIRPNKYMNLDLSVINIGGVILKSLSRCPVQKYDELLNMVVYMQGNAAKSVFLNSLSFLFLLGKISYQPQNDVIKLVEG